MRNLNELENSISSHFTFDSNFRTVLKGDRKVLAPQQVGYLARCCYKYAVQDVIKEIERTPQFMLRYKLRELKECYS